jgi:hypothetical protein
MKSKENEINLETRLAKLFNRLFGIGLLLAGGLMAMLFVAGFWMFVRAIANFSWRTRVPEGTETNAFALVDALRGLEYFFLAPLGYLVFLTLIRYLENTVKSGSDPHEEQRSEKQMVAVKVLIINLLLAIVATDLVSKILGPKGLSVEAAGTEVFVMGAFAGYFLLLERHRRE